METTNMTRTSVLAVTALAALSSSCLVSTDAAFGRGSGGFARGGGGVSAPRMSFARPAFSQPSVAARPSFGARPISAVRPSFAARPSFSTSRFSTPTQGAASRLSSGPSQGAGKGNQSNQGGGFGNQSNQGGGFGNQSNQGAGK